MFGYGEKYIMPPYVLKNAKGNPSPNKYYTEKNINNPNKGNKINL